MFLSECLHKVSEPDFTDVRCHHFWFQGLSHLSVKFLAMLIVVHVLDYEVSRIRVELRIHLQCGKVDDVSALVAGMVIPPVSVGIDHQHRLRVVTLRRIVELHVLESLYRFLTESSHELRQRNIGNVILCVPHSLKLVFEVNAVGEQEMSGIVAEDELLFKMGTECHMVRKIEIRRKSDGTAIDEGVFCLNGRAVA